MCYRTWPQLEEMWQFLVLILAIYPTLPNPGIPTNFKHFFYFLFGQYWFQTRSHLWLDTVGVFPACFISFSLFLAKKAEKSFHLEKCWNFFADSPVLQISTNIVKKYREWLEIKEMWQFLFPIPAIYPPLATGHQSQPKSALSLGKLLRYPTNIRD